MKQLTDGQMKRSRIRRLRQLAHDLEETAAKEEAGLPYVPKKHYANALARIKEQRDDAAYWRNMADGLEKGGLRDAD